jgi:hypothetical protein
MVRSVLADAVLLARGVAGIDAILAPALWRVILAGGVAEPNRAQLRTVAEDCLHATRVALPPSSRQLCAALARQLAADLQPTDRLWLDGLISAPSLTPPRLSGPADVTPAIDSYYIWLVRCSSRLTIPDLAAVSVVAARLAAVVGLVAAQGNGRPSIDPTVRQTIGAWRDAHHQLRYLRSIHPRPKGHQQAGRLASWLDQQVRNGIPNDSTDATWPAWTSTATAIAARLPALADAAEGSIGLLAGDRRLFTSEPETRQGQWTPAPPSSHNILTATDALYTARTVSAALHQRCRPDPAATAQDIARMVRTAFVLAGPIRPPPPADPRGPRSPEGRSRAR